MLVGVAVAVSTEDTHSGVFVKVSSGGSDNTVVRLQQIIHEVDGASAMSVVIPRVARERHQAESRIVVLLADSLVRTVHATALRPCIGVTEAVTHGFDPLTEPLLEALLVADVLAEGVDGVVPRFWCSIGVDTLAPNLPASDGNRPLTDFVTVAGCRGVGGVLSEVGNAAVGVTDSHGTLLSSRHFFVALAEMNKCSFP